MAKIELGLVFEQELEDLLVVMMENTRVRMSERLLGERPGEFTSKEGIIFSPDYIFDVNGELVLGEFKLTWYSSRGAPLDPKFAKWMTQIRLYCHWLQIRRAWLYVYWVNSDYAPPSPTLRRWEIVFNERELQDEFNMIARDAREKGLLK